MHSVQRAAGRPHHLDEPRHARPRVVALLDLQVTLQGLKHGRLLMAVLLLLREAAGLALLVEEAHLLRGRRNLMGR